MVGTDKNSTTGDQLERQPDIVRMDPIIAIDGPPQVDSKLWFGLQRGFDLAQPDLRVGRRWNVFFGEFHTLLIGQNRMFPILTSFPGETGTNDYNLPQLGNGTWV